jgi:TRAP-type transport system small permease protein
MRNILDQYYRLLRVLITLLMFVLIVPVTMQILSRYTGLIPRYIWTEEIARFCFIWIVMIGAMIAVRDGTHFDVDVLPKGSAKTEAGLRIFVHFAMLLASLIFVTYGYQFAKFGSIQQSEIAGLPMLTIYIAWPLAGATMVLFLAEKFLEDWRIYRGELPPPVHEIPKAE